MTAADRAPRRLARSGALRLVLSVVLAVVLVWFVATKVDLGSALAAIRAMSWLELATIAAVTAWNLVTYWVLWIAATPGLRWPQAVTLAQSGTALTNTVPGGSALGVRLAYEMLDSWGFSRGRSSQAVLVTGAWNMAIKLSLPVLAVALLALQGDATGTRLTAGIVATGVLAVAAGLAGLVFRGRTARPGGWVRRPGWWSAGPAGPSASTRPSPAGDSRQWTSAPRRSSCCGVAGRRSPRPPPSAICRSISCCW